MLAFFNFIRFLVNVCSAIYHVSETETIEKKSIFHISCLSYLKQVFSESK